MSEREESPLAFVLRRASSQLLAISWDIAGAQRFADGDDEDAVNALAEKIEAVAQEAKALIPPPDGEQ